MSYETLKGVGPGIDISHYGAPYKQMLGVGALGAYVEDAGMSGLGEMLYRYDGLGVDPWTGPPAEDPRIVKKYTVVRATYAVRNVPSTRAAEAASRILYQGQQAFPGNTVRKIGSTGWISGGRVGYEVILANPMRAGEIKQKNYQAGVRATAGMGGSAQFYGAQTVIPNSGFEATPSTPSTPGGAVSPTGPASPASPVSPMSPGTPLAPASSNPLTQQVGGLPVWAIGLIGIGVIGVIGVVVMSGRKKPVTANRRRRSSRRRSSARRRPRRNSRRRRTRRNSRRSGSLRRFKGLSAAARKRMPQSSFALSGKRFPIEGPPGSSKERDEWQAMQAIRYLNMGRIANQSDYLKIRNAIINRYGMAFWRRYDGPSWSKVQTAKRKGHRRRWGTTKKKVAANRRRRRTRR